MKGIIINEGSPLLENKYVNACYIKNGALHVSMTLGEGVSYDLSGEKTKSAAACCSKNDTYDFETGALIALMKMCGVDKVVRACNEAFSKEMYNTYITKFEGELHELKKENNILREANKGLQEEVKRLKGESENHWKKYQRNIQKKQDRINELERAYKASNDDEAKLVEYYQREIKKLEAENENLKKNIDELFESEQHTKSELGRLCFEKHRLEEKNEKLQHDYNLCLNSENALKYTTDSLNKSVDKLNKAIYGYKNDLYNTAKRCKELEEENEKLKLDCEKLQHGYIDTDMKLCGGRQNDKQYTALVKLFKKIDQKKVDAAYKEAYNTELPVWQKEVLKQMYDIHKESKEKIELPRTLDINGTAYRKTIKPLRDDQIASLLDSCKYAILSDKNGGQIEKWTGVSEFTWEIKMPTRREQKWEDILKLHKANDVIIEVKKEDVTTFLHEIEDKIPEITWASGNKIFEAKYTIGAIYEELKTHNRMYFRLSINNGLSYSSDLNVYLFMNLDMVAYLPPMRWDLFKKGRLVVKVSKENYAEFCSRVFSHFDKVGVHAFNHDYKFGYFMFNKDTDYVERILASDHGDAKEINRHKVVGWEDVR